VVLLAVTSVERAQGLQFTRACLDAAPPADIRLIEAAFDLVDDRRFDVFEFMDRSRANGNPNNYTFIEEPRAADWQGEVDEMRLGRIRINCLYNTTQNRCSNNPGVSAFTLGTPDDWFWDRVNLCVANIRAVAITPNSLPAFMAHVLAHELMHHADGLESEPNGQTSFANPQTAAETVGVAMEHLILTPNLSTEIIGQEATMSLDGTYKHRLEVEVENLNPNAGLGLVALSGATFNLPTVLCQKVDGVSAGEQQVAALGALSTTTAYVLEGLPGYDVSGSDYQLEVEADCSDLLLETNEDDNIDEIVFDTSTDLAVEVEVEHHPHCNSMEYVAWADPPGFYNWFEVPFKMIVTNLDAERSSPPVDGVMMYFDMWSSSEMTVQQELEIPVLEPGESEELRYMLDVPARDGSCSKPSGTSPVWFIADANAEDVHDSNRKNNTVELSIDDAWWKPDYRIIPGSTTNSAKVASLEYRIRNIGPVPAEEISFTNVYDESGASLYSVDVTPLGVGSEVPLGVIVPRPRECNPAFFTSVADSALDVEEGDESNNIHVFEVEPVQHAFCDVEVLAPASLQGAHTGLDRFPLSSARGGVDSKQNLASRKTGSLK